MASHTPAFFGRINELQFLKDHWELAKQGKPQIVNIIADTGVGKTRLVHEFYHWLASESSSSDDDYGYWPKNLGVGRQRVVNPPLDLFKAFEPKKDTIPWLWWGMYWTDADGENECALIRSHEYIQAHVDMLSIDKRFKASTAQAIMEWVKEEGLSHVVEWIPGGSQILNLGGLFQKIRKSNKEKLAMEGGIGEQSKNRLESLASDLIRDLSDLLSLKKRGGDIVPIVIFLDDIQFATDYSHDASTLDFLERLLNQSALEGWPLMLIATHWRAEWLEHSQPKQEINFKPWHHVVDGVSGKIHASELKLEKIPVADLRNVMLDILPGLDRDVQEKILGRVDNVRWLVEILNALRDDVENFLNGDRTKSLSDFGVDVTLSSLLKHSGYLDVIRHRLTNDSMRELRHILGAMAWNTPGLSFISELAKGFGQELMKHGILQSEGESPEQRVMYLLIQAIDPGSLVDGLLINNDIPSTISFPERGYLEVAKELFHTDRLHAMRIGLGNEVIDWLSDVDESGDARWKKLPSNSDRKVFLEIAYNVLGQLKPQLSDEQINELSVIEKTLRKQLEKGRIEEQDYHDQLNEAKEELLSEGWGTVEGSDYWQVVAGVELVSILHDEDLGRAHAYDFAVDIAKSSKLEAAIEEVCISSCFAFIDILSKNKELTFLLRNILKRFGSVVDLISEEDARLRKRMLMLSILSDLNISVDDYGSARDDLMECISCCRMLISKAGFDIFLFNNLGKFLDQLSDLDRKIGNLDSARLCLSECLGISQKLYDFRGGYRDLRGISVSKAKIANLDKIAGDHQSAFDGYQEVLSIRRKIRHEYGDSPEILTELGNVLTNISDICLSHGDLDSARSCIEEAIDVSSFIVRKYGETSERLCNLSVDFYHYAKLEMASGNYLFAKGLIERSLFFYGGVSSDFVSDVELLLQKAVLHIALAEVEEKIGQVESALSCYKVSLDYADHCFSVYDSNVGAYNLVVLCLFELSRLTFQSGDYSLVKSYSLRCLEVVEFFIHKNGDDAINLETMSSVLSRLLDVCNYFGDVDFLRFCLDKYFDVRIRLLEGFDVSVERISYDFDLSEKVAASYWDAGDKERARVGFNRCLKINSLQIEIYGETAELLFNKIMMVYNISNVDWVVGDLDSARIFSKHCREIMKRLLNNYEHNPFYLNVMAVALNTLASFYREVEDVQDAIECLNFVLELSLCLFAITGEYFLFEDDVRDELLALTS